MNEDLISRSALLEKATNVTKYDEGGWGVDLLAVPLCDVKTAPAVDALTVFKQIGLVKEAFEMAKADLMQVVQCKDCLHRETTKCPLCIVEFSELPDGKLHKHVIQNFVEDDFWCKKGERRSNDAADDADALLDRR